MEDKEKQAIETMQHWIDYEKANKDKINKADELIEIQETVLNLIESYRLQIIGMKCELEKQQNKINALQMEHNHDVKMIDEMAKVFRNSDYCFEITEHLKCNECINKNKEKHCTDCIKEYFKKKVETEDK